MNIIVLSLLLNTFSLLVTEMKSFITPTRSQGDIFVASKAAFEYPDTLNLFHGNQQHATIVKSDYKVIVNPLILFGEEYYLAFL